jgi:NAD(P)-dependent dehydrogenase (short-subunit alcohol dehydrogenase family)
MSENRALAVVTGAATDGIGTAITHRLVREGWEVFGSYEPDDAGSASSLASELAGLTLVEVDHADRESLSAFVSKLPQSREVSALVNAQFFFAMENPDKFDFALWDRSLAVNLSAPNFLYHVLRRRFAHGASVLTVTSTEAFTGSFGASAYAATKAAIHNLTKTLANNSGAMNVRVNAVAAGWIGGVMDTDEVFNLSRSITPLGRLGSPEEIAATVAFLLSKESSFINGSVIVADGGYSGVDTISKYEFDATKKESGATSIS